MASVCKVERQRRISASNADVYNSIDKIFIPGRNVLPRNVMQTNLGPFWGFLSKKHVKKAREFHCLNMVFVVWTLFLVDLTKDSNSYGIGIYGRIPN